MGKAFEKMGWVLDEPQGVYQLRVSMRRRYEDRLAKEWELHLDDFVDALRLLSVHSRRYPISWVHHAMVRGFG